MKNATAAVADTKKPAGTLQKNTPGLLSQKHKTAGTAAELNTAAVLKFFNVFVDVSFIFRLEFRLEGDEHREQYEKLGILIVGVC